MDFYTEDRLLEHPLFFVRKKNIVFSCTLGTNNNCKKNNTERCVLAVECRHTKNSTFGKIIKMNWKQLRLIREGGVEG